MGIPQYSEELCPSCGDFVEKLNDETGWCDPCSGITPSTHCRRCNQPLGANNGLCNQCKYILWLEKNADAIERVMVQYCVSSAQAKKIVLEQNRPLCLCCLNPIKGGTKGRHFFCTKTAKCRKAQNAYRYYKFRKGWSHEDALERALYVATEFTLIVSITRRSTSR